MAEGVGDAGVWPMAERLLGSVRRHLGVDVAFITEYGGSNAVVRAVAGDPASLRAVAGAGGVDVGGFGLAVLRGVLPRVVADARRHRTAQRLQRDAGLQVGACASVPVVLGDGHVFGALCALNREPLAHLGSGTEQFLRAIAEVVADQLAILGEEERETARQRAVLLDALEGDRLGIALQPVVDLHTGTTVGVEALARFAPPPDRPPDLWFAEAARHRLSLRLEERAVSTALALLGGLPDGWYLAVNASPGLLAAGRLAECVADAPLERVVVELTEHVAIRDYAPIDQALAPLRSRGLRLAIDDMGSGFASLRHVVRLSPDIVKMDGSLTRGLHEDHLRRALAASLVDFAAGIGADLVAECVETPADLDALRALGFTLGQGYLFAAPGMPADLRDRYPVRASTPGALAS